MFAPLSLSKSDVLIRTGLCTLFRGFETHVVAIPRCAFASVGVDHRAAAGTAFEKALEQPAELGPSDSSASLRVPLDQGLSHPPSFHVDDWGVFAVVNLALIIHFPEVCQIGEEQGEIGGCPGAAPGCFPTL